MDLSLLKTITIVAFFILIAIFAVISLMAAFVLIRYGRTRNLTIIISLVFGGLFSLGVLTTYLTLQSIF